MNDVAISAGLIDDWSFWMISVVVKSALIEIRIKE